jgi:aspartate aminotransferase-like enzyme
MKLILISAGHRATTSMSLKRLTMWVVLVELVGMGVLFAWIVAFAAADDGVVVLNLTWFGERWLEYFIMLTLTALTPYALYYWDSET